MKLLDIITSPWAITEDKLNEIVSIYQAHLKGEKIDVKGIEARIGRSLNNTRQEMEVRNGVAVIEINGVLAKRMNLFMDISGGTSTQIIGDQIRDALADEEVRAIILHIDSPGGTVDGTADLANLIFEGRGQKPIVAFVDGLMASAAFWIGSAADRVVISGDTTMVGHVGVISTHTDFSRAYEMQGVRTTRIVTGRFKAATPDDQPLSETGRQMLQEMVDGIMTVFVADLAKFRGVSETDIRTRLGEAQVVMGQQALLLGVVDGVSTLDGLLSELSHGDGDSLTGRETSNLSHEGGFMNEATKKAPEISAEYIKSEYPGIHQKIFESGQEAGRAEGKTDGAKAERERILAVKEQAVPGEEALIEELMFDGKTSGPEAAVAVLANHKAKLKNQSKALVEDSAKPVEDAAPPAGAPDLSKLPSEERAKAEWDTNSDIRAEFGSVEEYAACLKAEASGQARVLKK